MTDQAFSVSSASVRGNVYITGALLTDLSFRLPSGKWVEPFAKANWSVNQEPPLPGHMKRLGGEFFCLPFGGGGTVRDVAPGWEALVSGPFDSPMHGPCANDEWQLVEKTASSVTLVLHISDPFPIRKVMRRIVFYEDRPGFETQILVEARHDAWVPMAFHPIIRLPEQAHQLVIDADFDQGFTYPAVIEPARMATQPGRTFKELSSAPGPSGRPVDISRQPLGERTEDVVLLANIRGPLQVTNIEQRFAMNIDWSRQHLPHCMLWIHDRGLDDPPWNGQFRGLGIEPLASAFDAPWAFSGGNNPLQQEGYTTAVHMTPGKSVELWLSTSLSALD